MVPFCERGCNVSGDRRAAGRPNSGVLVKVTGQTRKTKKIQPQCQPSERVSVSFNVTLPMSGRGAAHRDKIRFYCDRHHIHGAVARYISEHPIWLPFSSKWTRTMSHEHDLVSIDVVIQQAKEQRAKEIAEACAPALKTLGGFALVAVLVPWQLVRQALSHMTS